MTDYSMKRTGNIIKELREKAGESQEQLAIALNAPNRETITRWENGARDLKREHIIAIAQHFNVSTDYLLGLSDIQTTDTDIQNACKVTGLSECAIFACGIVANDEKKVIELLLLETLKCMDEEYKGNPLLFALADYIFNTSAEMANEAFENMPKFNKIFSSKSMAQKICDTLLFDNIKNGLISLRKEASEHGEHNQEE